MMEAGDYVQDLPTGNTFIEPQEVEVVVREVLLIGLGFFLKKKKAATTLGSA